MSQPRLQALVEYLLDNLFDILTLLVAGFLVIRGQLKPFGANDVGELATWILAVLGLIAVSGLWDRNRRLNRIEKLAEENRNLLARHVSGKVRAADFFLPERPLLEKPLASASTIFLCGFSLNRTIRDYGHVLARGLGAGTHIRIIIADPQLDWLMQEFSLRSSALPAGFWRNRLETTRTMLTEMAESVGNNGTLEIGYLPYTPSFGLILIDPYIPDSYCLVEISHHKSSEPNAMFELRAAEDTEWYPFFLRQFENLWGSCRIEKFPQAVTPTNPAVSP